MCFRFRDAEGRSGFPANKHAPQLGIILSSLLWYRNHVLPITVSFWRRRRGQERELLAPCGNDFVSFQRLVDATFTGWGVTKLSFGKCFSFDQRTSVRSADGQPLETNAGADFPAQKGIFEHDSVRTLHLLNYFLYMVKVVLLLFFYATTDSSSS